jgi:hypothetical protein
MGVVVPLVTGKDANEVWRTAERMMADPNIRDNVLDPNRLHVPNGLSGAELAKPPTTFPATTKPLP